MAGTAGEELPLIAVLKEAIAESGLTLSELAKRSKVSQPQLSRFMLNQRTLTLRSAAKLFDTLGLEVSKPRRGRMK
jgi:transcriptional regulator with XRE-family HTH domain